MKTVILANKGNFGYLLLYRLHTEAGDKSRIQLNLLLEPDQLVEEFIELYRNDWNDALGWFRKAQKSEYDSNTILLNAMEVFPIDITLLNFICFQAEILSSRLKQFMLNCAYINLKTSLYHGQLVF